MRHLRLLSVLLIAVASQIYPKDRDWKQGKVVNVDVGGYSKTFGVNGQIMTKHRRIFTYSVDGGDKIYEAQEVGRGNAKAIRGVEVNGTVEYDFDKDHFYLRDSDGKTHKLDLVKTTRKESR